MTAYLIITVDYEIFGNGTGCFDRCVTAPAERMLQIANHFGTPLTFFVEALELISMEKYGLAEVELARLQLSQAALDGHDAQLHLHPQWENAVLTSQKKWLLDLAVWRMGDLSYEASLRLLKMGKLWLENLLKNVLPDYQCIAFRAGGWCIQPSNHVIKGLIDIGFRVDSTVAPGLQNTTRGEWSNFKKAPRKSYWKTENDVCCDTGSGVWEVPIATGRIKKWEHLLSIRKSRSAGHNGLASGCQGNYQGSGSRFQSTLGKIGKIIQLGKVMLDLSTMPVAVLIDVTQQWVKHYDKNLPIPIVAISHTKNFTTASADNMSKYLEWAKKEGFVFSTYGRWLNAIDGERNGING